VIQISPAVEDAVFSPQTKKQIKNPFSDKWGDLNLYLERIRFSESTTIEKSKGLPQPFRV